MIACLGPHRQSVIERLLLLGEFLIRVSTASWGGGGGGGVCGMVDGAGDSKAGLWDR